MVVIKIPKDEKTDELLDSLIEHLDELKQEASEIRKTGADTFTADMLIMDFLPKVKLARITYEEKDIGSLKSQLAKIRHELDLIKTGSDFDNALLKIQNAYDKIREGKYSEAYPIYIELRSVYKKLSGEMKQIVYKASLDIYRRLQEHT